MPENICELKDQITEIVDEIVQSYWSIPHISHIGRSDLPNRDEIIRITNSVIDLIYPGFFGKQNLCVSNTVYFVGEYVDDLYVRLSAQILKALTHEAERLQQKQDGLKQRAFEETIALFKKIPRLRSTLSTDVQAAFDGDPAAKNLAEIITSYPCIVAITAYRVAHELHLQGIPLIPRIMTEYAHSKTGIDIHPGAQIGPSFFIDHGTGVVIGETTIIGANVKIYQGVTLGAKSFPKDKFGNIIRDQKRHPTVEDGAVIYANATILGGDTIIGANSTVGGSVWLIDSVPPNTMVVLEPPAQKHIEKKPERIIAKK